MLELQWWTVLVPGETHKELCDIWLDMTPLEIVREGKKKVVQIQVKTDSVAVLVHSLHDVRTWDDRDELPVEGARLVHVWHEVVMASSYPEE